jgi:hypothetical protein
MLGESIPKGPSRDGVRSLLRNTHHMMKIDNFSIQSLLMNDGVVTMKVLGSGMNFEKES